MARMARVVVANLPHHVVQRGAGRVRLFAGPADYRLYLELLGECSWKYGLEIHAYCLMPDHLHLVCVPRRRSALAGATKEVGRRYARYVGKMRRLRGDLWAGRPQSCVLDRAHAWEAVRHVEQCPVRGGKARRAERYRWSSAAGHCGLREDGVLSGGLEKRGVVKNWARWLKAGGDEAMVDAIRRRTRTGRPAGSKAFVERIERKTRRNLTPRPPGRPKKGRKAKRR